MTLSVQMTPEEFIDMILALTSTQRPQTIGEILQDLINHQNEEPLPSPESLRFWRSFTGGTSNEAAE